MIWLAVGFILGFSLGVLIQCVRVARCKEQARADRRQLQEIKKCFSMLLDESQKNTIDHDYHT